jgi:hypothetical protein
MITIRLRQEIAAPTAQRMKGLPILPGELMVPGILKVVSATIEEIDINGESQQVKAITDTLSTNRIRLRLLGTADDLTDGAFVSLTMDIIEETREQPRE